MIDWGLFQSFKLFLHTISYHCIRIAAAAEGVVYEVVAEPQGQALQQEDREEPAQGPIHPSTEQQPTGKPQCISYYFKFMTPIYVSITCGLGLGIVWNSSCMIPSFPGVILVCIGR